MNEQCDFCEGAEQGHLETPMLRGDIPNAYVRTKVSGDAQICEHCARAVGELIGEDWREEKSMRMIVSEVNGWRRYDDGQMERVEG